MNKICLLLCCLLPGLFRAGAQELKMTEYGQYLLRILQMNEEK